MIDTDRRLVLLAENRAGAAPWYQLAYERLVEETPFHFGSVAAAHRARVAGGELRAEPRPGGARRSSSSTTGSRRTPRRRSATRSA